jgi:hypothetical protein
MTCLADVLGMAMLASVRWLAAAALPPEPDSTCEVLVEGLPGPARAHHRLELSGGYVRLGNDGTRIRIGVEPIVVRLKGPRYTGEIRMTAAECAGDRVVVLHARPLPAVIVFVAAAPEMIVQCTDCAGDLGARPWLAEDLPPIPVGHGRDHRFEIRAPGYRALRRKVWLLPGPNRVELALEHV